MKKLNIGLDFDGVIADCGKLKRAGAGQLFGIDIPEEKFKKEIVIGEGLLTTEQYRTLQKEIYDNPDIGLLAEPVIGVQAYVRKLQEDGHVLSIVTSRDKESLEVAKQWLHIHALVLPIIGVGQTQTKEETCRSLNLDVFIDDDLDKLQDVAVCVSNLFLFSWGYNAHIDEKSFAKRVFSWQDFYQRINTLAN